MPQKNYRQAKRQKEEARKVRKLQKQQRRTERSNVATEPERDGERADPTTRDP